jgi:hypothetical protein
VFGGHQLTRVARLLSLLESHSLPGSRCDDRVQADTQHDSAKAEKTRGQGCTHACMIARGGDTG